MTLTEATKIIRSQGFSVGRCHSTKRVLYWRNNKIVFEKFMDYEIFKNFAIELNQPEKKAETFAKRLIESFENN